MRYLTRPSALAWPAAVLLAAALLVGCGGRKQTPSAPAVTLTVIGTDYAFDPADLTVTEGDTVKVIFKNEGAVGHTWEIPAFNIISEELMTGESQELTFVADKAGLYEVICGVVGHADLGMVGTLTVNKP